MLGVRVFYQITLVNFCIIRAHLKVFSYVLLDTVPVPIIISGKLKLEEPLFF